MLPKLSMPTYELTLPSNNTKIKYRPFKVKERATLLMALESGISESVINAIGDLFELCTFGKCILDKMPIVDAEYLFINIRNKSIGEGLDIVHDCECGANNKLTLNMENIIVEGTPESRDIDLGEGNWLKMNYPTLSSATLLSENPTEDEVLTLLASSIDTMIFKEVVHKAVDYTLDEIKEYISEMTQIQITKMERFFDTLPKVVISGKYKCSSCYKENEIKLEGIENFFA